MNMQPALIDTHVHFLDKRQKKWDLHWSWAEPEADHPILGNIDAIKSIRFDLEAFDAESRFAGVSSIVHIQAAIGSPDPVTETKWLDEMVSNSEMPVRIVGHVDLGMPKALSQITAHLDASSRFVGVRDFSLEPVISSGNLLAYSDSFNFMVERELLLDLDCEYQNFASAKSFALMYPELTIVLEHIGFPRKRDAEYFAGWSIALRDLAEAPNVFCKVSGLGMTDPRFSAASLENWMQECLTSFGPERLVLGSNWPVDRLFSSYDSIIKVYRDFFSQLSMDEQELVLNKNAARIYRFST